MDLPINHFKRAIKSGQLQIGLWCSLASHISAEILSGSGFDWLLLDTEHSPNELPMVYGQLQAVAAGGRAHPIVRIPWNDMVVIKRYLDAGVQTLLIPTVQTEDEAKQAVAATRYPPRGVRGFASASRSSRFGRIKDYHTRARRTRSASSCRSRPGRVSRIWKRLLASRVSTESLLDPETCPPASAMSATKDIRRCSVSSRTRSGASRRVAIFPAS